MVDGRSEYILEGKVGRRISGRLVGCSVDCRVGNWELGIPRFHLRISSENSKEQSRTVKNVLECS